jgi:hypothetical protein
MSKNVVEVPTATGAALDAADQRAVARIKPPVQDEDLASLMEFGEIVARSKFFTDAQGTAQAVVKLAIGRELGLSKTASLTQIYIFEAKGRTNVIIGAHLIAAKINASAGYRFEILESSTKLAALAPFKRGGMFGGGKDEAEGEFVQVGPPCRACNGNGEDTTAAGVLKVECAPCYGRGILPVTFTVEDAGRADLLKKDNWKGDPEAMLYARGLAKMQRRYFADLFTIGAVYVPEEFEDAGTTRVATDDGRDVEATVQRPRRASEAAVPSAPVIDVQPEPDAFHACQCGAVVIKEGDESLRVGAIVHRPVGSLCYAGDAEPEELTNEDEMAIAAGASRSGPGSVAPIAPGAKKCPRNPKHAAFFGLFCPECQGE